MSLGEAMTYWRSGPRVMSSSGVIRRSRTRAREIAGLPLRVGGDNAVLGDGAGAVLGPSLVGGGADGLGEFLRTLGVGAREAQDLDQFGQMQEGLAVLLAPARIERRDRLGEAPEVDALAGSHGVAVHDRLEIAKARHLIDDDQQIALKRFDTGDGVGDGDPQAQPALDVLDGLLGRNDEEVGIALR